MVVESDTALIAVFVACVLALVAATVVFVLFLSAGLTVLRAKGYGRSAGWWGSFPWLARLRSRSPRWSFSSLAGRRRLAM